MAIEMDMYTKKNMFANEEDDFEEDQVVEEEDDETEVSEDEALIGLFNGHAKPNYKTCYQMVMKAIDYNTTINLSETVKVNENFFIGKQWEGVEANGLPTPQINILKRVCLFTIATITTDNIKVTASTLANTVGTSDYKQAMKVVNDEIEAIFERNKVSALIREYARNAAVDGDACLYTYWDAEAETGQEARGQVVTEIVENTRVFFGNPADRRVQSQPWIAIEKRLPVREARIMCRNAGNPNWRIIEAGEDNEYHVDSAKHVDDITSVFYMFWKDDNTGEVNVYTFCRDTEIEPAKSLGIKLYPITWMSWDAVADSYHGQSMITPLINNQIFINKAWAMSMVSIMHLAFPSKVYDKTRITKLDNRVGAAYGVNGNVTDAIKVLEGASISPQVSEYILQCKQQTEESCGATSVALGDTRPDNTSAIIALQRAASTPSELTKHALYESAEDLARIYFEFMGEYYGLRYADRPITQRERDAVLFVQMNDPNAQVEMKEEVPELFDFSLLKMHPVIIKLDTGASTYYSEIASIQTLENLLMNGHIDSVQFLERLPDDYVPERMGLIAELKQRQQQQQMMMGMMPPIGGEPTPGTTPPQGPPSGAVVDQNQPKMDIKGGGGYSALQRKINEQGNTNGIV